MTDQDKVARFPDGDSVHPLTKHEPSWYMPGAIVITSAFVIIVLIGVFYLMFALVGGRRAHAEETTPRDSSVVIYESQGECFVDVDLRVTGTKRAACVDRLETAARLARAEMRVNERPVRTSKR